MQSERLLLLPIKWSDLENIHRLHVSPEVARFNTFGIPGDLNETRRVLKNTLQPNGAVHEGKYGWTIRQLDSGDFIGEVGISIVDTPEKIAAIFYNLLPNVWGQGLATEAAWLLLKFGFEYLHMQRIEAGVAVDNIGSIRVLEKIGMRRKARSIKILPIDGNWQDNYSYAIAQKDYYAFSGFDGSEADP